MGGTTTVAVARTAGHRSGGAGPRRLWSGTPYLIVQVSYAGSGGSQATEVAPRFDPGSRRKRRNSGGPCPRVVVQMRVIVHVPIVVDEADEVGSRSGLPDTGRIGAQRPAPRSIGPLSDHRAACGRLDNGSEWPNDIDPVMRPGAGTRAPWVRHAVVEIDPKVLWTRPPAAASVYDCCPLRTRAHTRVVEVRLVLHRKMQKWNGWRPAAADGRYHMGMTLPVSFGIIRPLLGAIVHTSGSRSISKIRGHVGVCRIVVAQYAGCPRRVDHQGTARPLGREGTAQPLGRGVSCATHHMRSVSIPSPLVPLVAIPIASPFV